MFFVSLYIGFVGFDGSLLAYFRKIGEQNTLANISNGLAKLTCCFNFTLAILATLAGVREENLSGTLNRLYCHFIVWGQFGIRKLKKTIMGKRRRSLCDPYCLKAPERT